MTSPAAAIRIMHFADVHFGVETYGKYNPETGLNTRLEDFARSLDAAIDTALAADVDIALFAGDAYKARDPNQTHQRAFAGCLKRLTDAGVPVAMVVGNHDIPNTRGRAHALEIYGMLGGAGVRIISQPEAVMVQTRRGEVLVAGIPYMTRSRVIAREEVRAKTVEEIAHFIRDRYALYAHELADQVQREHPEHIALLMGHFTISDARVGVQGFLLNPNEPQVPVSEIALGAFDYVAMGHVHKHQEMNRNVMPPVVYSGSIDRIDFGERAEEKGFVLAEIHKKDGVSTVEWKHVPVDTRRFLDIHIDAADTEDPTQAIIADIARHPIAGAIVKVSYKVPPDRSSLVRVDEIRRALAPAHLVVALSRELPPAEALVRSQVLTEALTPERALSTYLDLQPRLVGRKDDLMEHARPLIDALEQEETLR